MLTTYIQRSPFLFVLSLLLIGGGLWVNILWLPYGFSLWGWLFNCLPGLALLLTWFLAARHRRKRWRVIGIGAVLTLLITVFVGLINVVGYSFVSAGQPVTDVSQYAEVRSSYSNAPVNHFPETIPPEATDVKFYYRPGALQGPSSIQVWMQLPREMWSRLKAEYETVAQYRYTEEDRNSNAFSSEEEAAAISHVSSFLTSDEHLSFPDSYEILIFGFQDNADLDLVICYGVALNADPPEIVYWTNG
ncbi:MAG: hypothetical protein AAGF01_05645 [Cyanobacteria bacterium P01_G01_bin.38]